MTNAKSPAPGPRDVTPSLLWALYTTLPVPHELVDFPASGASAEKLASSGLSQVAMVPISLEDQMKCEAEADDFAKKTLKDNPPKEGEQHQAYASIFQKEALVRILFVACRDPSDPTLQRKTFPSPKAMRLSLTPDQISVLGLNYLRVERLLSPIRWDMSLEEMDALIDRLREGARAFPLDLLPSEQLKDLVMRLVSRLSESPAPSGSPGEPPSESGSTEADRGASPEIVDDAPVVEAAEALATEDAGGLHLMRG